MLKEIFTDASVMELNTGDVARIKRKDGGYVYPEEFSVAAQGKSETEALVALEEKVRTNFSDFKTKIQSDAKHEYAVTIRPVLFIKEPAQGNPIQAYTYLSFTAVPA